MAPGLSKLPFDPVIIETGRESYRLREARRRRRAAASGSVPAVDDNGTEG